MSKEIALLLWRSSLAERMAVGVFQRLQRGTLLTTDERVPLDLFIHQEMIHGNLLRACARQYSARRPSDADAIQFDVWRWPEHTALAFISTAERLVMPGFDRLRAFFDHAGDFETAAVYRHIAAEEPAHIQWGRQVLARCRRDPALAPSLREFFRSRIVPGLYRAAEADQTPFRRS